MKPKQGEYVVANEGEPDGKGATFKTWRTLPGSACGHLTSNQSYGRYGLLSHVETTGIQVDQLVLTHLCRKAVASSLDCCIHHYDGNCTPSSTGLRRRHTQDYCKIL